MEMICILLLRETDLKLLTGFRVTLNHSTAEGLLELNRHYRVEAERLDT